MMSKAADFRAKADECEKKAEQAKDVEAKQLLMDAAQNWRSMAAQAERHGW
jgi:hypothetical protein